MSVAALDEGAFTRSARTARERCGATPAACPTCAVICEVDVDLERLSCPTCRREWLAVDLSPCPSPASVRIVDAEGDTDTVCLAHAALFHRLMAATHATLT